MKKPSSIKSAFSAQNSYFKECGHEIAARNLELMCTLCVAGVFIYLFYDIVTLLLFPQWAISSVYCILVPVLTGFFIYARKKLQSGDIDPAAAMTATTLLYISVMAEIIALSVFPHPEVPSVYFPLFLILGPVMFILPMRRQLAITVPSFVIFVLLVVKFKSPSCWSHELFEASTAFLFSVIAIILMMQMRVQSDLLKDKYYALSRMDELTGALNKSAGLAAADAYLASMREGELCAALFADIDDFKRLNDTRGHLEGDRCLKALGASLQSVCRRDDIVFRFGGDEFIVLLKDISGPGIASQRAEQFLASLAAWPQSATCSIGICCAGGGITADELVRRADSALYKAKENGKNSCAMYEG